MKIAYIACFFYSFLSNSIKRMNESDFTPNWKEWIMSIIKVVIWSSITMRKFFGRQFWFHAIILLNHRKVISFWNNKKKKKTQTFEYIQLSYMTKVKESWIIRRVRIWPSASSNYTPIAHNLLLLVYIFMRPVEISYMWRILSY